MASSKLTLSIETSAVDKGKKYARSQHMSLSKLVQNYLNNIPEEKKEVDPLIERLNSMEIPKDIEALSGILKGKYPDDTDFRELKYEYLKEKYDL